MRKIRILVVDDSIVMRRALTDLLNGEPDCEVVGTAANGRIALAKLAQAKPDIVTLDVEMPEMDGLETLTEIRKTHPRLPVVMFSALAERAAAATLRALALGATDYVTKPSSADGGGGGLERIRDELIPKIRCLGAFEARGSSFAARPPPAASVSNVKRSSLRGPSAVDVVAIGSSTGGPNALGALLPKLNRDLPVPVVISQHMPPLFTRLLAERLDMASDVEVREAAGGESLDAGHVFVAPGDHHMEVRREGLAMRVRLHQGPHENSCRPAVDVMFRAVAAAYGPNTLAVVLTGMGQDGLRGCEAIRAAGGQVIVQDEATSVVWGMPGAVAKAGLADAVVPLADIAGEILRRVRIRNSVEPGPISRSAATRT